MEITEAKSESEGRKSLEPQVKKDKLQVGFQIPLWNVNLGINKEKDLSSPNNEQYLQNEKVAELGQKLEKTNNELQEQLEKISDITLYPTPPLNSLL